MWCSTRKSVHPEKVFSQQNWARWLAETDHLAADIRSRLGRDLSVDDLLFHSRQDLEHRTSSR
jgi:hypothetical protein